MSMWDLKGNSGGNYWNYSNPQNEGYMTQLTGTVVEMRFTQKIDFNTKKPAVWPDGNPRLVLNIYILGQSGRELDWVIEPKGNAAQAILAGLDPQGNKAAVSFKDLLGKNITVSTQEGVYRKNNPRPWYVQVNGEGDHNAVRGAFDFSPQQVRPEVQPQAQPQPQPQQSFSPQSPVAQAFQQHARPVDAYAGEDIPF